jgi:hypothetical protein
VIVAFDANCLVKWSSRKPGDQALKARLEHLVSTVSTSGGRIVIPTPAFAEFLVGLDEAAAEWIEELDRKRSIFVAPLDRRAAFECSLLDKAALNQGDKRGGRKEAWQRIKIDRQIVAIARVAQASIIVSDDAGLRSTASAAGLLARQIGDLELPESDRQQRLPLGSAE